MIVIIDYTYVKGASDMSREYSLSPQDREVLEVLWENGEMTVMQVLEALGEEHWSRHTVKVYLLRLIEKQLVDVNKISRKNQFYFALISKEEFTSIETSAYLNKRYSSLAHMVAGLAMGKQVSNEELDELEAFLSEYRKGDH